FAEPPEQQNDFGATLSWESGGGKGWLGVQAETPSANIQRVPYAEETVTLLAQFDEKRVLFSGASPFSFVATVVPLHKALLLRNKIAKGAGQWVFTRLDLTRIPEAFQQIKVEIDRVLGEQLAKSTVAADESPVGAIYFSWLPSQ
ncbi:MAG: hypothetical protein ABIR24_03125, partial [Verrucomicrobiota bacterium]